MTTYGHQVDTTVLRNEQELKHNLVAICRITMFIWIQKDSKDNPMATSWMTTLLWNKKIKINLDVNH
jgi:hypothetical protein